MPSSDDSVEILGFKVRMPVEEAATGTRYSASIGGVTMTSQSSGYEVTMADFARWQTTAQGNGDTPEEARTTLTDLLRELASSLHGQRKSDRLAEANAEHQVRMQEKRRNRPWSDE